MNNITTKRCPDCKEVKERGEFNKNANKSDGFQTVCRPCQKTRWGQSLTRQREIAFTMLGNACVVCGNMDFRVLQVDHINNDGYLEPRRQRRKGLGGTDIKSELTSGKRSTDGLQLLCANCHSIKSWHTKAGGQ